MGQPAGVCSRGYLVHGARPGAGGTLHPEGLFPFRPMDESRGIHGSSVHWFPVRGVVRSPHGPGKPGFRVSRIGAVTPFDVSGNRQRNHPHFPGRPAFISGGRDSRGLADLPEPPVFDAPDRARPVFEIAPVCASGLTKRHP